MSDTGRDDRAGYVEEPSWVLDWRKDAELEGEMNVFEHIGLAFMAVGIALFILIGIVCIFSRFIK